MIQKDAVPGEWVDVAQRLITKLELEVVQLRKLKTAIVGETTVFETRRFLYGIAPTVECAMSSEGTRLVRELLLAIADELEEAP